MWAPNVNYYLDIYYGYVTTGPSAPPSGSIACYTPVSEYTYTHTYTYRALV